MVPCAVSISPAARETTSSASLPPALAARTSSVASTAVAAIPPHATAVRSAALPTRRGDPRPGDGGTDRVAAEVSLPKKLARLPEDGEHGRPVEYDAVALGGSHARA